MPGFTPGSVTVSRRFSDFAWLRGQLALQLHSVIVPPIPAKGVVGRFEPAFVAARLRGLARFMRRCASVPAIAQHTLLQTFLTATPDEYSAFVATQNALHSKSIGATLTSAFGSVAAAFSSPAPTKRTDADISVDALEQHIKQLEPVLESMVGATQQLQGAELQAAEASAQLGAAYGMLGAAEEGALGNALQEVGRVNRTIGGLLADSGHRVMGWLVEDMSDALRNARAAQAIFDKRREYRTAHATALSRLAGAKAELSKAGGPSAGEAGATAAAKVQEAETAVSTAEGELHDLTAELVSAVDNWRVAAVEDFIQHWLEALVCLARRSGAEAALWGSIEGAARDGAVQEASSAPHLGNPLEGAAAPVQAAPARSPSPDVVEEEGGFL